MTCCLVVSPTWIFAIVWSLAKSELPIDTQLDSNKHKSINQKPCNMPNSIGLLPVLQARTRMRKTIRSFILAVRFLPCVSRIGTGVRNDFAACGGPKLMGEYAS